MSNTPAPHPPGPALSADAARAALAAWLEPMAELALQAGLSHAELDELWRLALVARSAGRNTSQLSVATGLHRKEVARLQTELAAQAAGERRASPKRPWASQVVLRWADGVRTAPNTAVLPLLSDDAATPCFAKLSRSVTTDVHPRAVLEELLRLGLVSKSDDRVSLLAAQFVPRGCADEALATLRDNVRDHMSTGLANIGEPNSAKCLEQALWGEGISLADARQLNDTARHTWGLAHQLLYKQISDAPEAPPGQARHRVRIGMYVTVQEMPHGPSTAAPPLKKKAARASPKPPKR